MSISATAVRPATLPDPFVDPGLLVDRELELITPSPDLLEDVVRSAHAEVASCDLYTSPAARSTRLRLEGFLAAAPQGHEIGRPVAHSVSAYHFWMLLHEESRGRWSHRRADLPPVPIAGMINLRLSHTQETERHYGHIGYHVFPAARGRHYAERACQLLAPLARYHALNPLWITCNPDNIASRRTCERLGARLVEIVDLPLDHPLRHRGEARKCRFRWDLRKN